MWRYHELVGENILSTSRVVQHIGEYHDSFGEYHGYFRGVQYIGIS